ncbi:MAG: hypothetical protein GDA41_09450 [Rhodospirillales bacterium]|nr:hypothetical protein [Rhodospirillales bacterium]
MSETRPWLAEHGLEKHADLIAAKDIGTDILEALEESDLKDLGLSLGDRKRAMAEISFFDPSIPANKTLICSPAPEARNALALDAEMPDSSKTAHESMLSIIASPWSSFRASAVSLHSTQQDAVFELFSGDPTTA